MWTDLLTILSIAAPLALMFALWVLAQISRRFGEVTLRPPHYRALYISMGLMSLPALVRLLTIGSSDDQLADLGGDSFEAILHDLPFALAIVLAIVIAWRYWGWLIYANENESTRNPQRKSSRAGKSTS